MSIGLSHRTDPDRSGLRTVVYPVFGTRLSVHRLVRAEDEQPVSSALAMYSALELPWDALWELFQAAFVGSFQELWVVDLRNRSRSLPAGQIVFDAAPTSGYACPAGTPKCVIDALTEASEELPDHAFYYLEPLWINSPLLGRRLLSAKQLQEEQRCQERAFRRHTKEWADRHRRSPRAARRLHWLLYDPLVVALAQNSRPACETELFLIAHWD